MPEFDSEDGSTEAWNDEGEEEDSNSGNAEEEQCVFWIC